MRSLLFFGAILFLFASCQKETNDGVCPCVDVTNPNCPNFDPCSLNPEPKAEIIASEGVKFNTEWIVEDSIFVGNAVKFESPFSNDTSVKHTWYIGVERMKLIV